MRTRGLKALVCGIAAVGLAAAVWASAPSEQPKAPKKSYKIGLIAKSTSNPVFIAARTGANDAARELGKELGVTIEIDWRTPVAEDAQKQAEAVEQLAAAGADGIAISVTDAKILAGAIDSAADKGVTVVTFDSDAPKSKRMAYYGTDDFACGQQLGRELAKSMGGKGVVAILAGNQTAPNLQGRVRGVKDVFQKEFKDIKVLDTYYHGETAQEAVQKLEQVQGAHPEITGWAMVGGWPLFTANALDKVAGKAKVVAVDALPAQLKYLENGQVEVLLGQKVYEWGYESVRLIMNKALKGESPKDPVIKADLVPVTKATAAEYAKNWKKWLGEK
jgi:ribose transport system substrate-binding protein